MQLRLLFFIFIYYFWLGNHNFSAKHAEKKGIPRLCLHILSIEVI